MNRSYFPLVRDNRAFLSNMLRLCQKATEQQLYGRDFSYIMNGVLTGNERIWGEREVYLENLAWCLINCGDCTLVVIGGATQYGNINEFVAESNVFRSNPSYTGVAPLVKKFSDSILTDISRFQIPIAHPVFLTGYSMGGAVAYALAEELTVSAIPIGGIWTFGSPRPGGPAFQLACQPLPIRRYYNIDDPVRSIPPHFDEAWSVWPFINQFTRNKWNAQVQVSQGICIDGGGVLREDEDLSPISGGETIFSVARYYLNLGADIISPHLISVYIDRLQKLPDSSPINPIGPSRPREQLPVAPTARETEIIVDQGIVLQENAAMVAGPPRQIFVSGPGGTKSEPYRARHRDGIWTIERYGEVYDVGPGKRRARSKARAWNKVSS